MTSKLNLRPRGEIVSVLTSHSQSEEGSLFTVYILTKSRVFGDCGDEYDSFSILCMSMNLAVGENQLPETDEKFLPDVFLDEDDALRFIEEIAVGAVTPCTLNDVAVDRISQL
ncbi:MAG: hypothetical protein LUH43_08530 [Clostridia bacterium]|nr:hypothetical protein [Clostridia bacterium]